MTDEKKGGEEGIGCLNVLRVVPEENPKLGSKTI